MVEPAIGGIIRRSHLVSREGLPNAADFDEFLELTLDEQLAILPKFD